MPGRLPQFYFYKYVLGEPPAFLPVNLAFGAAIHTALAAYYSELKSTGLPPARDHLLDTFRAAWAEAADGPVPLQPDEDDDGSIGQITDRGVSLLHAFHEHASRQPGINVEGVEKSFSVALYDPSSGELLEEQLIGTVDLVVNEGGERVVVEHKTSAKKYSADQLRWDIQPTAYKHAARASGLGEVRLRYQVLTKTKVPAVQVADVERTSQDETEFLRIVVGVLRAVEAGVDYPLRGWRCQTCPFAYICR